MAGWTSSVRAALPSAARVGCDCVNSRKPSSHEIPVILACPENSVETLTGCWDCGTAEEKKWEDAGNGVSQKATTRLVVLECFEWAALLPLSTDLASPDPHSIEINLQDRVAEKKRRDLRHQVNQGLLKATIAKVVTLLRAARCAHTKHATDRETPKSHGQKRPKRSPILPCISSGIGRLIRLPRQGTRTERDQELESLCNR